MEIKNLKEWHEAVCQRDGYVCRGCKKDFSFEHYFDENGVNQYVCGHHIKTQKGSPELKLSVLNGVCVCFECHTKIHKGLIANNFINTKTMNKPKKEEVAAPSINIHRVEGRCKECNIYEAGTFEGLCFKCERQNNKPLFTEKKKKKK